MRNKDTQSDFAQIVKQLKINLIINIMKRGHIKIEYEYGKMPFIEMHLENNNLWLAKEEIARLFGVFNQKIYANIRSIFKDKLLEERDVTYFFRYIDKGIEKQSEFYNLEMLIFLSYRIGTMQAQVFRQFLNYALREHLQKKEVEKCSKLTWHFRNNQDFWMN